MTAAQLVAAHYRRKADRHPDAFGRICLVWAEKAEAGHVNALVRRVERILSRSN